MAMKYCFSKDTIKLWWSMSGVKPSLVDKYYYDDPIEVRDICSLSSMSNIDYFNYFPQYSQEIDNCMEFFLDKVACNFDYSNEGQVLKENYFKSFFYILNVAMNLNLAKPDTSVDYELHFRRMNRVLVLLLNVLSDMEYDEVIHFASLISNGNVEEIRSHISNSKYQMLVIFTLLGMLSNNDIDDSVMFYDKSSDIDADKLGKLYVEKIGRDKNINIDKIWLKKLVRRPPSFTRVDYISAIKMNNEQ